MRALFRREWPPLLFVSSLARDLGPSPVAFSGLRLRLRRGMTPASNEAANGAVDDATTDLGGLDGDGEGNATCFANGSVKGASSAGAVLAAAGGFPDEFLRWRWCI